jgi:hypothetical protein
VLPGVVLTGMAIVPSPGFTGRGGDEVITMAGLCEVHDVVGVAGIPRLEGGG